MDNFVLNGQAHGSIADRLLANGFNVNVLRPYTENGRSYITKNSGSNAVAVPIANDATLRKDDWIALDEAVLRAARPRLKLVGDLMAAGLRYSIPNGMGSTVFQSETISDPGSATISMDGLRKGKNDRPEFGITNLPLPIIHSDFSYSARQIAASRNGGSPLDTVSAEAAARRVSEEVEKLALGVSSTYSFGGGVIYGLTNFTSVLTQVLTAPTAGGWTAETLLSEILEMRQSAQDAYHYGPYNLYFSSAWDQYLDEDYKANSDITLRERIAKVDGISKVATVDYLTGYKAVLVQMTSEVIRMIEAMPLTTVQWESEGGMLVNFKVMTIAVPQVRADFNGKTGIVYGATA